MSERVDLLELGPHEYSATIREGETTTTHRVSVPADLLADLGVAADGEAVLVRESIEFLLEREKATEILPSFSLEVIARYFPEYTDEIRTRLS